VGHSRIPPSPREAIQAARQGDGGQSETMLPSWQDMTARADSPEGRKLYKKRNDLEPVFAQLVNRLSRDLNYRGALADAEPRTQRSAPLRIPSPHPHPAGTTRTAHGPRIAPAPASAPAYTTRHRNDLPPTSGNHCNYQLNSPHRNRT